MSVSREELKRRACEAVDKNRDKIIAFGESVFAEPELGFKEFKTSAKVKKAFEEMASPTPMAMPSPASSPLLKARNPS